GRVTLADVVSALDAKQRGRRWQARCPAHDDHSPSLDIGPGSEGAEFVAICRAGCDKSDVFNGILARCGRTPRPARAPDMRRSRNPYAPVTEREEDEHGRPMHRMYDYE